MSEHLPITTLAQGSIAIRESTDGDGRTVSGVAVPWASRAVNTREYGSTPERFERGAFSAALAARAGRPVPLLDRHGELGGAVIGAVMFTETEEGLEYEGRLLTSQRAQDAGEIIAAGVDGVSLEFYPGPTARDGGEAVHKRGSIRSVIGLALAYAPALAGASASVRMEGRQMETIATEATTPERPAPAEIVPPINVEAITRAVVRTELDEFRRTLAETAAAGRGDPFDAIRSMRGLGEMYVAGSDKAAALDVRRAFARALDDNITGDSAGVVTPGVIQDVKRIVNAGRPGIAAFGAQGLPDEGMAVTWPYLETGTALTDLFGAQPTGEKNEIVSGEVHIDLGSSNLITYAGGSDISYQLLRRSSPSYLEAYTRILLAAWALITDTAFVNAVEAAGTGSVVIDWAAATLEEMQEAALTASVAIKAATGQPAEFILAGDATFIAIGSKMTPAPIVNALGTATASTLSVSLSGLPVLHDPAVNVGTAVISNREAARWFEDGPFPATEEDVAKLGRNVAYWSMGAAGVFVPAGVVKSATS